MKAGAEMRWPFFDLKLDDCRSAAIASLIRGVFVSRLQLLLQKRHHRAVISDAIRPLRQRVPLIRETHVGYRAA